jgi:hypothetical protein
VLRHTSTLGQPLEFTQRFSQVPNYDPAEQASSTSETTSCKLMPSAATAPSCKLRVLSGTLESECGESSGGGVPGDCSRDRRGRKRPPWLPSSWRERRRRLSRRPSPGGSQPACRRGIAHIQPHDGLHMLHADKVEALLRSLDSDLEDVCHPGRVILLLGDVRFERRPLSGHEHVIEGSLRHRG